MLGPWTQPQKQQTKSFGRNCDPGGCLLVAVGEPKVTRPQQGLTEHIATASGSMRKAE